MCMKMNITKICVSTTNKKKLSIKIVLHLLKNSSGKEGRTRRREGERKGGREGRKEE